MYEFKEIGPEPQYPILNRSDILQWIGVSGNMLKQIRKAALLPWKRITPEGHRYYRKEDVRRVFLTNFRT